MSNEFLFAWALGCMFTAGFLQEEIVSSGDWSVLFLVFLLFFAWPVLLGCAIRELLEIGMSEE